MGWRPRRRGRGNSHRERHIRGDEQVERAAGEWLLEGRVIECSSCYEIEASIGSYKFEEERNACNVAMK